MAAEAAALLDALMGQDRNAPVPGASGLPDSNGNLQNAADRRSKKRSCYDPDICPLYCAWSISDTPTWYENVAANEGAGGIDVYDLFTNTKSDLGPNPFRVDETARAEFAALPDHEKRRLGYEDMLCRKLADLVRQCDRSVSRNKEKLRQEVAKAMKARHEGKGRGNREDLITTVNQDMLEACAASVAQTILIEDEMAELVTEFEELNKDEVQLLKTIQEEAEGGKKKKKKKKKSTAEEEENDTDPRILEHQKKKLDKVLQIQSLSLQLPALRDNTDNLMRQLQYLRSDTATDKIVCEVSGNFMSSRDADERIAAHYAGKQYVGWKLVRDKLKELQKKGFGRGGGGGGPPGPGPPMDRGGYRDDRHHGGYGGGGGYGRRDEPPPPRYDPGYRDRGRGGFDRGYDDRRGYGDRGGRRY
eukprot:scaffold26070_cov71-Cyclotella_meneghiniana.AAC.9